MGAFTDLVPRLEANLTVWETLTPPAGTEIGMTADDYLDRWLADVRASDHVVHTVFGFCVGSVFAAAMAEQVTARQGSAPRLILFDPERPHAALLHRHYGDALQIISMALSDTEMKAATHAGEAALEECSDLTGLATRLSAALLDIGDPALRRAGLGEQRRTELLGTFGSFLNYLAASAEIDPGDIWPTATAISSATPRNGLNVLPPEQRADAVAREIRFDLQHADLLRSVDVAKTVDELLRT
ncbi:hypothetical protein DPM19_28605 [Actinomadura craniellae]|uniref:Thioesterase domain-containing protein n=1 Tax=Actinomadura craniellae TaxID=2231787 RepID=A0A365GYM5_9ACTN|nr:hypothetical protein DPM19_28605 [Actinomadura craniellae]